LSGTRERAARRAWPIACTFASIATGLAFCLAYRPLVGDGTSWIVPGDIWGTFRSAHLIGWGDFGDIYNGGTNLVTFPGILLLLAPVAMVAGALGMSESFPLALPHPSAWIILGPYEIALSCVALFALDALAERLGVPRRRRALLCVAEAAVLWNVSVVWGHPEDALAVGFALYALIGVLAGRYRAAGWLMGAAVVTQPLVLLMLPVLLAVAGRRGAPSLIVRAMAPAVFLLAVPLVAEFHATAHTLVDQPNYPVLDHATPWTALAPRLGGHGKDVAVAGGPGRLLALVFAGLLGLWARRWRDRPDLVTCACALALALRCFTESVMVPFYVWPALAVGLVACATIGNGRLVVAVLLATPATVYADLHLSLWVWWLPVTGAIVAVLGLGVPMRRKHFARSEGLAVADEVGGTHGAFPLGMAS
jgi:hypothetical protein